MNLTIDEWLSARQALAEPVVAGTGWRWWQRDPATGLLASPWGFRAPLADVEAGGWLPAECPHPGLTKPGASFHHPADEPVPVAGCICGWHIFRNRETATRYHWPNRDHMRLYRVEYGEPVVPSPCHYDRRFDVLRVACVRICEEERL